MDMYEDKTIVRIAILYAGRHFNLLGVQDQVATEKYIIRGAIHKEETILVTCTHVYFLCVLVVYRCSFSH